MSKHGTHSYDRISKAKMDAIITALTDNGAFVSGSNPWSIDTRKHGVRLHGEWNEETATLKISVTEADWYVPSRTLWENIDALMSRVQDAG
jgi:hypothetical protein